jgi:hypothetical protein
MVEVLVDFPALADYGEAPDPDTTRRMVAALEKALRTISAVREASTRHSLCVSSVGLVGLCPGLV